MKRGLVTVRAGAGLLGCLLLFFEATGPASAGGAGTVQFGHLSPPSTGPVSPFEQPRYDLGPGNTASEAGGDGCYHLCITEATGTTRHMRHVCRKSCASAAF
jgi:hypothetical protein